DTAAPGRVRRIQNGEVEVLHLGREDESEQEQRRDRHRDEDRHGEAVSERRSHLADEEGTDPPPAHAALPVAVSDRMRRKTPVMAGCSMWTRSGGALACRTASVAASRDGVTSSSPSTVARGARPAAVKR